MQAPISSLDDLLQVARERLARHELMAFLSQAEVEGLPFSLDEAGQAMVRDYVCEVVGDEVYRLARALLDVVCLVPLAQPGPDLEPFELMIKWPPGHPTFASTCRWFHEHVMKKYERDRECLGPSDQLIEVYLLDGFGDALALCTFDYVEPDEQEDPFHLNEQDAKTLLGPIGFARKRPDGGIETYVEHHGIDSWKTRDPGGAAARWNPADELAHRKGYFLRAAQAEQLMELAPAHPHLELSVAHFAPGQCHFLDQSDIGAAEQAFFVLPLFSQEGSLMDHQVFHLVWFY